MLSLAMLPLLAGIGWNAPHACPTEASFRQLVEARLGGASPEAYSIDVDAWVRDFGDSGYELALQAKQGSLGPTIEFTTVSADCQHLTDFAAAWAATQIDPLGVGPEPEPLPELQPPPPQLDGPDRVAEETPSDEGETKLDETEPECECKTEEVEGHPVTVTQRDDASALRGIIGVSGGAAFALISPVVTTVNARVGLKWRSLQATAVGHSFIDSGLSGLDPPPGLTPRLLVVWSAGPELCWAPQFQRFLLWGCGHFDGGQAQLSTNKGWDTEAWMRIGVSARVGLQATPRVRPFLSVGFSQITSDVRIEIENTPGYLNERVGSFVSLEIGADFILRSKPAKRPKVAKRKSHAT